MELGTLCIQLVLSVFYITKSQQQRQFSAFFVSSLIFTLYKRMNLPHSELWLPKEHTWAAYSELPAFVRKKRKKETLKKNETIVLTTINVLLEDYPWKL